MFAKRPILSSALVAGTAIGGAYLYADYQDLWDDKSIERRDENAVDVQRPEIGEAQPTVLPNSEQATAHGAGEAPAQGTTPDTEVQTFPLPPTGPIEEQDLPPLPNPSKEASTPLASRPSRETPILTNPSSDMASRPHPASREGNRQAKRPSPAVMPDYSDQNPKPPPSLPQTLWERASSWVESSWQRVRQEARDFFDPPPPVEPILQRNQPAGAACVRKTPLPGLFAGMDGAQTGADERFALYRKCVKVAKGYDKYFTDDFLAKTEAVAGHVGAKPAHLLAVMAAETGGSLSPKERNDIGATGIIQFTKTTAKGLGTSTQELAGMINTQQLDYVQKYLEQRRAHGVPPKLGGPVKGPVPLDSIPRLYGAVWYGTPLDNEDTVLHRWPERPYLLNWNMDVDPRTGKLEGATVNPGTRHGVKGYINGNDLVWFIKKNGTRANQAGCTHFLD